MALEKLLLRSAACSIFCFLFQKLAVLTVHESAACESGMDHLLCCCLCRALLDPIHLLAYFKNLLSGCIKPVTVRHLCNVVETTSSLCSVWLALYICYWTVYRDLC